METPPRRPYVSPPPHPTNTTRPLPPLARCLFYHPPAPLLEPPFRESTRNSYRSADEFEVLRILRGVLLTTGSSLFLSPLSFSLSPLPFIFLFFPRFSSRSFFPHSFRLLRVASLCFLRPRRPYFGSEEYSSPFPTRAPLPPPPRVIRNRALLDLAASPRPVFPPRLLHAFHLAIFAKERCRVLQRRLRIEFLSFDRGPWMPLCSIEY